MSDALDREIRLKQVYSQLDRKFEEDETQKKALKHKLPYINLYGFPVDPSVLSIIPKNKSIEAETVLFFKEEGRNLKIGSIEPNQFTAEIIKKLVAQSYFVEQYVISMSSLKHMLTGYDKVLSADKKSEEINIVGEDNIKAVSTLPDLAVSLKGATATQLIDVIMGSALGLDSSDVHIEPEGRGVKIRFRIDGVLQDVVALPLEAHHTLVSRIKILSKLKLNVTTVPQDGSFSLTYNQNHVDVRVSILPSAFGESTVMRILRQDKQNIQFDSLGLTGLANERLLKEMNKPNGMILTTGPTGSGKTTTLYAILNKLNEPGVKIITLEDPVEYKVEGITQSPIDVSAGMTFASGLRAILRQDPDIVMVGEMRDLETAEIAAQAALTGHIVLSTLHTNDAPSAIPRLIDLGIKPFILGPAINAIIGQRLVRRICSKCKTTYQPAERLASRVRMILDAIPQASKVKIPAKLVFYHSPGCKACNGLGYKGRVGIYEIFTLTEAIEKLIQKEAVSTEIRNMAISEGMITMAQDGILKALVGVTDVEEVFRVTEE